jgi:3-deoxy-7-phosphoheptulonate synthase
VFYNKLKTRNQIFSGECRMMIIMNIEANEAQVEKVVEVIKTNGFKPLVLHGDERKVIAVVGNDPFKTRDQFLYLPGVDRVLPISRPYKVTSREFKPQSTVFALDGRQVGGEEVLIMAGPCSVESRTQLLETALAIKEAGGQVLRGGAYKPRTSPYSFQGLGEEGLELLAEARELTGLPIVTEVTRHDLVPLVAKYADVLQIGARNMQNFALLTAAGQSDRPILLKRGNSATIEELLMSAEYILSQGNPRVILCERGIRTFETSTRNTTDINAVPVLKSLTHLPVFLDPSHSTGHWEYVTPIARAGIAAGADGLIIEVHPNPEQALSDGGQSLKPERFAQLVRQVRAIARDVDRR